MGAPSPIVAVNDIVEVTVVTQAAEQIGLNRLHYLVATIAGTSRTLSQIASDLDAAYNAAYKSLMPPPASYYGLMVRIIFPLARKSVFSTTNASQGPGTSGISCMGRQLAGMITKQSTTPGPGGRGRVYVPFPSAGDDQTIGQPTAGYMVNLGVLAGILQAVQTSGALPNTASLQPIILNRVAPASSRQWLGSTSRQKWATQKRRGTYGRANPLPF